jgi:hypothetical protein
MKEVKRKDERKEGEIRELERYCERVRCGKTTFLGNIYKPNGQQLNHVLCMIIKKLGCLTH